MKPLLFLFVFLLSACARDSGPVVYTIEELARLAMPAVAHVETDSGTGTGFLLKEQGYLVTNFHVLVGADAVEITLGEQTFTEVEVVSANVDTDLVLLRLPETLPGGLPLVSGIDQVNLGEQVVTLGNPRGLRGTLSHGVVSTVQREMEGVAFQPIQTTASISGGSSGGPLLNMRGEVIGVTSFTYKDGQNLNFAVPADHVRDLLNSAGGAKSLAQVFGSESPGRYHHREGEFAVVLSWDGDPDLDLELWSDEFVYLTDSFVAGPCWDITQGGTGEEYFVFGEGEYSTGRFILSPYFVEGVQQRTEARLTVYYPDGRTRTLNRVLDLNPPQDQWFALRVDVDKQEVKILDFFMDAPTIVLLEWDQKTDLDLVVFDHDYKRHYGPSNLPGGRDVTQGREGVEVFRFGEFGGLNFQVGNLEVLVSNVSPSGEKTEAELLLVHEGRITRRFTHFFAGGAGERYLWHAMSLNPETAEVTVPKQSRLSPRRARGQEDTGPGIFP